MLVYPYNAVGLPSHEMKLLQREEKNNYLFEALLWIASRMLISGKYMIEYFVQDNTSRSSRSSVFSIFCIYWVTKFRGVYTPISYISLLFLTHFYSQFLLSPSFTLACIMWCTCHYTSLLLWCPTDQTQMKGTKQ